MTFQVLFEAEEELMSSLSPLPALCLCRLALLQFPSARGSVQFPPPKMMSVNVKELDGKQKL